MAFYPQKTIYFDKCGLISHKIIQKDLKLASICSAHGSKFHENTAITLEFAQQAGREGAFQHLSRDCSRGRMRMKSKNIRVRIDKIRIQSPTGITICRCISTILIFVRFECCCLFGQFKFWPGGEILYVILQVISTRQSLTTYIHLASDKGSPTKDDHN